MKRTTKALLLTASLGAAAALPAVGYAQGAREPSIPYLGLQAGTARYGAACDGLAIPCDDSDTSWRFFGGYQFSRNLSVELGLANLGAASASGGGAELRYEVFAWDLSMLLGGNPTPNWFVYGKAGLYRAEVDVRDNVTARGDRNSKNGGLSYGFGGQYSVTRSIGLRAEYQQYTNVGKQGSTGEDDVGAITLGIVVKF